MDWKRWERAWDRVSLLADILPAAETVSLAAGSRLASGSIVESVFSTSYLLWVDSGFVAGAFPFGRFLEP